MKRTIKAAVTSLVLALAVVIGIVCTACSSGPVVFKDEQSTMGFALTYTLTLEDDGTCEMVVAPSSGETNDSLNKIINMLHREGTYTYDKEADVYTVTFKDEAAIKSTYDEGTKTYTLAYSIAGRDSTVNLNLKYSK